LEEKLAATLPAARPPQQCSSVDAYRAEIAAWRAQGLEIAAIRGRLEEMHGAPISYSAVWRLARGLAPARPPEAFVRVEVPPGTEGQVDFGYAGRTVDPATAILRKTWVFVLVLSWSRHLYAELVFDQRVETWLLCHRHAFEAFGGYVGHRCQETSSWSRASSPSKMRWRPTWPLAAASSRCLSRIGVNSGVVTK
jgi:transposase